MLGARVLSDAYNDNEFFPNSEHLYDQSKIIFIYYNGFVFRCISGSKGKNYQYSGSSFNLLKPTNP